MLLQEISIYLPPEESYDDIWESFTNQSNVYPVIATRDEIVVGYGSISIETKIRGGKIGHIEDVVCKSSVRHSGIGRLIIDALYEIAKENNCYKVALHCQHHSVKFYEKCGYIVNGSAMQRVVTAT